MICSKSETMQCCCNGVLVLRLVQISVAISDDETNSWLLATCSEVLLEKLTVAQLAKKFHTYMERGISQSHEQERNTLSCTELYCVLHRAVLCPAPSCIVSCTELHCVLHRPALCPAPSCIVSCTELYCVLHRAVWSHFTTTSSFTDRPSRTQFHAVFFFHFRIFSRNSAALLVSPTRATHPDHLTLFTSYEFSNYANFSSHVLQILINISVKNVYW